MNKEKLISLLLLLRQINKQEEKHLRKFLCVKTMYPILYPLAHICIHTISHFLSMIKEVIFHETVLYYDLADFFSSCTDNAMLQQNAKCVISSNSFNKSLDSLFFFIIILFLPHNNSAHSKTKGENKNCVIDGRRTRLRFIYTERKRTRFFFLRSVSLLNCEH